jgi:hypothetical protein
MNARILNANRCFGVVLLAAASACSSAGSPTLDTGLPRETPANEVTAPEAMLACAAYEELANEALGVDVQAKVACAIVGIVAELSGNGSCNQALATCVAEVPDTAVPIDFSCELATSFAPSGCTATIGELEDCVNAVSAGLDHFTSSINCGLVDHLDRFAAVAEDAATVANPDTYPACQSLSVECLGLLGWVDTSLGPLTGP